MLSYTSARAWFYVWLSCRQLVPSRRGGTQSPSEGAKDNNNKKQWVMLLYFERIFVCGASIFPSIFFPPPSKDTCNGCYWWAGSVFLRWRQTDGCKRLPPLMEENQRQLSSIGSTNTHDTQRITFRTSNIKVMDAHTHTTKFESL